MFSMSILASVPQLSATIVSALLVARAWLGHPPKASIIQRLPRALKHLSFRNVIEE
jgi:hypothetical protein